MLDQIVSLLAILNKVTYESNDGHRLYRIVIHSDKSGHYEYSTINPDTTLFETVEIASFGNFDKQALTRLVEYMTQMKI